MDDYYYNLIQDRRIAAEQRKKEEARQDYERRKKAFLESEYVKNLIQVESGGDPNAKAPGKGKTASGLYQMTNIFRKQGENEFMKMSFYDPTLPISDEDKFFSATLANANAVRKILGRDPNDWELYAAHNLGSGDGPSFLGRYYKSFKRPWNSGGNMRDGNTITFDKEPGKKGRSAYEDYLGYALDNNEGVKLNLVAAAHSVYNSSAYHNPYNLTPDEKRSVKRLIENNPNKVINYGAYTVKNLARYYKEHFGGWDSKRTWNPLTSDPE